MAMGEGPHLGSRPTLPAKGNLGGLARENREGRLPRPFAGRALGMARRVGGLEWRVMGGGQHLPAPGGRPRQAPKGAQGLGWLGVGEA
jgi:hypothetical protein